MVARAYKYLKLLSFLVKFVTKKKIKQISGNPNCIYIK